jgi:hypothetical protein
MEQRSVERVRFVALRGPEPTTLLRFHPRLTVLSGFSDGLVDWLAGVFAHGAAGAPDGFAVLGGARFSLSDLPSDVFGGGACPIVRAGALQDDLQHLGQGSREELGFELNAVVDAIAAARRRTDAMAEQIVELDRAIAEAEARVAELNVSEPPARRNVVVRDRTADAARLEQLLTAVLDAELLPKEPHPEAEALARAFDSLDEAARRRRPRAEVEEELRKWELVTAEARARLAERRASAPRISPADLAEATRLREALNEATDRKLGRLRRRPTEDAPALQAQLTALLARLGVRSYDDLMLLGTGLGSADPDLAIREATNVVAAAERRCADLRAVMSEPDIDELRAERAKLVERAQELLRTDPGSRPAIALREYRIEPAAYAEAQVALARALREYGAHVEGTVIDTARHLIAEWSDQRDEHERGRAELQRREDELAEAERVARQGRTMRARIAREIESRRTEIEDLEYDRRRLDERVRKEGSQPVISTITPAIVERVVADVLNADGVAGSRLPIIVEDPFGPLTPELRRHALNALARRAGQSQVVLVTPDPSVVQWARNAGENVAIAWTAQDAQARLARQTA